MALSYTSGDFAIIAFSAVFLSFAAPGIPRGAFIMLTPLFLTIGLPAESIGILIAVDAIPDIFATVLNTTGNLAAAALRSLRPLKRNPVQVRAILPSKLSRNSQGLTRRMALTARQRYNIVMIASDV